MDDDLSVERVSIFAILQMSPPPPLSPPIPPPKGLVDTE